MFPFRAQQQFPFRAQQQRLSPFWWAHAGRIGTRPSGRSFWTTAFISQSHRKVSDHAQVWKSHQHDKRLLSLAVMHQVLCASKIPPQALGSVV